MRRTDRGSTRNSVPSDLSCLRRGRLHRRFWRHVSEGSKLGLDLGRKLDLPRAHRHWKRASSGFQEICQPLWIHRRKIRLRPRIRGKVVQVRGACRTEDRRPVAFSVPEPVVFEAKKLLFRMAMADRKKRAKEGKKEIKLMFIDGREAHLDAVCDEEAWVEPPEGAKREHW